MHVHEKNWDKILENILILNQMEFLGLGHLYIKIETITLYLSAVMPRYYSNLF